MKKPIPFAFALEALASLEPSLKPMFGCYAVYVRGKMMLVLRERPTYPEDNGVWLATTHEFHDSLRVEFPTMRSVSFLGKKPTGVQVIPMDAEDFESSVERACELILRGDPRIGRERKAKISRAKKKKT
ncbi:MAG TPA: hypothetical protein VM901_07620 [Bdellovibrionota bacterium]|jgi:hypothetical protein|nr:hypothetical protein [Bdellovibrionota bacterium]